MPGPITRPIRRDASQTRLAILFAAQEAFSRSGYRDTGVREITASAGTSPALAIRYFGSKEKLFEAALFGLLDARAITTLRRETFGPDVVRILTTPGTQRRNPLSMMVLASADPIARAITQRLLANVFAAPLARWFGGRDGAARAACLAALAAGVTIYRELYPLDPLTAEINPVARGWLETAFQSLVD